jgi:UDP-N-acetylmuramoylalanine--D-glutamate ligase
MEEVLEFRGISFINDSKSTTVDATLWALNNLTRPVVLIAGGRDKSNDYAAVAELASRKVKSCLVIGEAREKIIRAFSGKFPVKEALSLKQAVETAFKESARGDCVLFSPMCKSFDMFTDYEDRGRAFKSAVKELAAAGD